MYKCIVAFVGVSMVTVTLSSDCLRGDTLTFRKAWLSGGRTKAIEKTYRYGANELLSGKVSVDLGGGCIVHLKNGTIYALQSKTKSTLNPVGDKSFLMVN
jgi:hypothetical protein